MNDDLFIQIDELRSQNTGWQEIVSTLQIDKNPEAVRSWYRRKRKEARSISISHQSSLMSRNWREILQHAKTGASIHQSLFQSTQVSSKNIDTEKPVIIWFASDFHVGAPGTNYHEWEEHITLFMENENVFMIDLGDEIQNMRHFNNLTPLLSQVISPDIQLVFLRSLFEDLIKTKRIIAKVKGNHDYGFDEKNTGEALTAFVLEGLQSNGVAIFNNKGLLTIKVGQEEYKTLIFHKGKGGSLQRPAAAAFGEFRNTYPAEIVAGGHDHRPGFEMFTWYNLVDKNRETFLIKCGTFQSADPYGEAFFSNSGLFQPCVILFPREHKKIFVPHLRDAIRIAKVYDD